VSDTDRGLWPEDAVRALCRGFDRHRAEQLALGPDCLPVNEQDDRRSE
jgi:hypothetical protein